jgi:hypothetical protein
LAVSIPYRGNTRKPMSCRTGLLRGGRIGVLAKTLLDSLGEWV